MFVGCVGHVVAPRMQRAGDLIGQVDDALASHVDVYNGLFLHLHGLLGLLGLLGSAFQMLLQPRELARKLRRVEHQKVDVRDE